MSISRAVCCGLLTVFGAGSIESVALAAPTTKNLLLAQTPTNSANLANTFGESNTIFLRDLTSEWRCMSISGSGELGFTRFMNLVLSMLPDQNPNLPANPSRKDLVSNCSLWTLFSSLAFAAMDTLAT
jgi:hypothetical protein